MESLYLLVPLSVLLVLALIGLFGWAINSEQFDDLEREGWRVLEDDMPPVASTRPELDQDQTRPKR
jgi:cbb3-type cytochrome oxidase maturation protein